MNATQAAIRAGYAKKTANREGSACGLNGSRWTRTLGRRVTIGLDGVMSLAENAHRLRITDGKTIQEVADGAKISAALVAAIENGRQAGMGRQAEPTAVWEISAVALKAKRYGEGEAIEDLPEEEFGSERVRYAVLLGTET